MNGVDDLGRLFDELVAGHRLHRELLDLGDGRLLGLAGGAAPVAVEHTARLDAEKLKCDGRVGIRESPAAG